MREDVTYHLTPVEVWVEQRHGVSYVPGAFDAEGFIHCTDGTDRVIEVGNRYYVSDIRAFCVLLIERARIQAEVIYEDPDEVYPHIYGALNTDAVGEARLVERDDAGGFLAIGDVLP